MPILASTDRGSISSARSKVDDWKVVEGKRDQLVGKIHERYGIAREEAERQLGDFERTHERV
jgi:uncharacterized protein YjbJ (UPF0337 family)